MPRAGGQGEGPDGTAPNASTGPAAGPSRGPERGRPRSRRAAAGQPRGRRWRPPTRSRAATDGAAAGKGRGPGRGPRGPAVPTSQAVPRLHAEDGDGAGAGAILLPVAVLKDVPDLPQVLRLTGLRLGGRRARQLPLGRHGGREAPGEAPCGSVWAAAARLFPLPPTAASPSPPNPRPSRQAAPKGGQSGAPPLLLPFPFPPTPPGRVPSLTQGPAAPLPLGCLAGRATAPRARLSLGELCGGC